MRRLSLLFALLPSAALADARTQCPSPAPCKVIVINAEEEKALVGSNMVLDTAVQGRQIDLFGVVSYFRSKIATAPAGDAPAASAQPQGNPALGAGPANPTSSVDK